MAKTDTGELTLCFLVGLLMGSSLMFECLIHFGLIFVYGIRECLPHPTPVWLFSFPGTIYWSAYPFPIVSFWIFCCELIFLKCVSWFLDSWVSSIGLYICIYISTMLLRLLQIYSVFSSQVVWWPQLNPFWLKIPLVICCILCFCMYLMIFFFYLCEGAWGSW